jgi:hypothetical protein
MIFQRQYFQVAKQHESKPVIFHDARLHAVGWRDLVPVTRGEIFYELLHDGAGRHCGQN